MKEGEDITALQQRTQKVAATFPGLAGAGRWQDLAEDWVEGARLCEEGGGSAFWQPVFLQGLAIHITMARLQARMDSASLGEEQWEALLGTSRQDDVGARREAQESLRNWALSVQRANSQLLDRWLQGGDEAYQRSPLTFLADSGVLTARQAGAYLFELNRACYPKGESGSPIGLEVIDEGQPAHCPVCSERLLWSKPGRRVKVVFDREYWKLEVTLMRMATKSWLEVLREP